MSRVVPAQPVARHIWCERCFGGAAEPFLSGLAFGSIAILNDALVARRAEALKTGQPVRVADAPHRLMPVPTTLKGRPA
jgi:hypothetical protein